MDTYILKKAPTRKKPTHPLKSRSKKAQPSVKTSSVHSRQAQRPSPTKRSPSEPEPFPLSGFDTIETDAQRQQEQAFSEMDYQALSVLLEENSADSPTILPNAEPQRTCQFSLGPQTLTTTSQLLSDDDDDCEDEDAGSSSLGAKSGSAQGPGTLEAISTAEGRCVSPPETDANRSGGISPSVVMSNSSYDTMVSPSYAPSQPMMVGVKRARSDVDVSTPSIVDEDDLNAAWDSASDCEDFPAPGDATPTRPTKARVVVASG